MFRKYVENLVSLVCSPITIAKLEENHVPLKCVTFVP